MLPTGSSCPVFLCLQLTVLGNQMIFVFSPVVHLKALSELLTRAFVFPQYLAICGHQIIAVSCWDQLSHLAVQVWNKLSSMKQGQPPLRSCQTWVSFQKRDMLFAYIVHQMASMLGFLCLPWNSCGLGRAGRAVRAKWITQNSMGLVFAIHLGTGKQICKAREAFGARQGSWGTMLCHGNKATHSISYLQYKCVSWQIFFWVMGVQTWFIRISRYRCLVADYPYLAENMLIENHSYAGADLA